MLINVDGSNVIQFMQIPKRSLIILLNILILPLSMTEQKPVDKNDYLKKYLSGKDDKKKKKTIRKAIGTKVKIIDDDIDVKKLLDHDFNDDYALAEEAPQIAGIIDERPLEVQMKENFVSLGWKTLNGHELESSTNDNSKSKPGDSSRRKVVKRRQKSDSDESPPRRQRNDSDVSPPRRRGQKDDSDVSPPRRRGQKDDSDVSPPRRRKDDSDVSPPRRRQKDESDVSPPRRRRKDDSDESPPRRRHNNDSDASPPRKRHPKCDPDASPPRRHKNDGHVKSRHQKHESTRHQRNDPSPTTSKSKKKSRWNKDETPEKPEKKPTPSAKSPVNFANPAAVKRDKQGHRRNLEKEKQEQAEKDKVKQALEDKYYQWGRGLKQTGDFQEKIKSDLHEMSKPLARYADDKDLEDMLKAKEVEGDPMLKYIKSKRKRNGDDVVLPEYQGDTIPNRYNIAPGYRWDGVDRSNGYEKRFFEIQNNRKAMEELAHKWSTEDM